MREGLEGRKGVWWMVLCLAREGREEDGEER